MTDLTNADPFREMSSAQIEVYARTLWAENRRLKEAIASQPNPNEAARRLAATPSEDETVKAEPILDHRGHLIGWRRTEQEPILRSYRKGPAQQNATLAESDRAIFYLAKAIENEEPVTDEQVGDYVTEAIRRHQEREGS